MFPSGLRTKHSALQPPPSPAVWQFLRTLLARTRYSNCRKSVVFVFPTITYAFPASSQATTG